MSNTIPEDRVRIFDRLGNPLGEFRAPVERSYVIGDTGRASFTYPTREITDADGGNITAATEKLLQYGNWLLVENSDLPPWVGVIDTPREWSPSDVRVYAYAPEHVFSWRRGPTEVIKKVSAGSLFEMLLSYVNQAEQTIVVKGNIWRGGPQREETLNPNALDEYLIDLYERSGEEYRWRPVVVAAGKLVVYADWTKAIGQDTEMILQEGTGGGNVEWTDRIMVEDGPIINDLLGYGEGATWQDKPIAVRKDIPSRRKYGLRQSSEEFYNVESDAALVNNVKKRLKEYRSPSYTFSLNALNVGQTWRYCRIGNTLTLKLDHTGFYRRGGLGSEAQVRVIGMRYDPATLNKLELVVIIDEATDE